MTGTDKNREKETVFELNNQKGGIRPMEMHAGREGREKQPFSPHFPEPRPPRPPPPAEPPAPG